MKKGQVIIEYLIILAIILMLALFALAMFAAFPDFAKSVESKHSQDFWKNQAKPFTIEDAFYDASNGRVYFAIKSNSNSDLMIKKLLLEDSQIALFNYSQGLSQGVGSSLCDSFTCMASGCNCFLNISSFSAESAVSEYYATPDEICGQKVKMALVKLEIVYSDAQGYSTYTQGSSYPLVIECKNSFNN